MDAAGKPQVSMILNATVLWPCRPSLWLGCQFGIEGAAVAFSLAALLFGELPSFVLTTRELSLKRLTVWRRIQGVFISSAASFLAIILVSHALADIGLGSGSSVLLSGAAGGIVYAACLTVLAQRRQAAPRNGSWPEACAGLQRLTGTKQLLHPRRRRPRSSYTCAKPPSPELTGHETPRGRVESESRILHDLFPECPQHRKRSIARIGTH